MGVPHELALPPVAARYFPPASGRYEVKPGLVTLGTDFGNGTADDQVFQFDAGYVQYRKVKQLARAERLSKYYQTRGFGPEVAAVVCRFIAGRLAEEHPELFGLEEQGGELALSCAMSGELLRFDRGMRRVVGGEADPPYADPFDALATQVQEDLAVVRRVDGKDWTCAIHLCFPHRWTAEEKIGLDFVTMHLPVPGMESFRKPGMVTNMIEFGPFTRFVWELCTDDRLNHHREPPPGTSIRRRGGSAPSIHSTLGSSCAWSARCCGVSPSKRLRCWRYASRFGMERKSGKTRHSASRCARRSNR